MHARTHAHAHTHTHRQSHRYHWSPYPHIGYTVPQTFVMRSVEVRSDEVKFLKVRSYHTSGLTWSDRVLSDLISSACALIGRRHGKLGGRCAVKRPRSRGFDQWQHTRFNFRQSRSDDGVISYTGGQSVSHVLLWQPSECVHLIVMIVLCCFRKINMMMMMMMSWLGVLTAAADVDFHVAYVRAASTASCLEQNFEVGAVSLPGPLEATIRRHRRLTQQPHRHKHHKISQKFHLPLGDWRHLIHTSSGLWNSTQRSLPYRSPVHKFTTLNIHNSFTLSLQDQNLPLSQILPTIGPHSFPRTDTSDSSCSPFVAYPVLFWFRAVD